MTRTLKRRVVRKIRVQQPCTEVAFIPRRTDPNTVRTESVRRRRARKSSKKSKSKSSKKSKSSVDEEERDCVQEA
jgi:hypothetical protein